MYCTAYCTHIYCAHVWLFSACLVSFWDKIYHLYVGYYSRFRDSQSEVRLTYRKWFSQLWSNLSSYKIKPRKNPEAPTAFQPMTSAIPLRCSTKWVIKPHWKQVKCEFNLYPLYEENNMMCLGLICNCLSYFIQCNCEDHFHTSTYFICSTFICTCMIFTYMYTYHIPKCWGWSHTHPNPTLGWDNIYSLVYKN